MKSLISICRPYIRTVSTTSIKFTQASLIKLKKLQADFQRDDGKPVFLKGGLCDRLLYTTTLILCAIGIVSSVIVVYDNAKPTSWKTKQTC